MNIVRQDFRLTKRIPRRLPTRFHRFEQPCVRYLMRGMWRSSSRLEQGGAMEISVCRMQDCFTRELKAGTRLGVAAAAGTEPFLLAAARDPNDQDRVFAHRNPSVPGL
jgi:hypothetical protein